MAVSTAFGSEAGSPVILSAENVSKQENRLTEHTGSHFWHSARNRSVHFLLPFAFGAACTRQLPSCLGGPLPRSAPPSRPWALCSQRQQVPAALLRCFCLSLRCCGAGVTGQIVGPVVGLWCIDKVQKGLITGNTFQTSSVCSFIIASIKAT